MLGYKAKGYPGADTYTRSRKFLLTTSHDRLFHCNLMNYQVYNTKYGVCSTKECTDSERRVESLLRRWVFVLRAIRVEFALRTLCQDRECRIHIAKMDVGGDIEGSRSDGAELIASNPLQLVMDKAPPCPTPSANLLGVPTC